MIRLAWLAPFSCVVAACASEAAPERTCTAHSQCDDGFLCGPAGTCRPSQACAHDTECCPGAVCFSGWCRPTPECVVGQACPGLGQVCEATPELAIAGATGPGVIGGEGGVAGRCVPAPCDLLGACPEPYVCVAGRCLLGEPCGGACGAGLVCEATSGRCLPAPGECACTIGTPIAVDAGMTALSCGLGSYGCGCAALPTVPGGRPGVDGRLVPALASDAVAALVSYEPEYGDLVLSRFVDPLGARSDIALDGVPGATAVAAGAYRGGVLEPGPDRGRRPSVVAGPGGYDILYRDLDRQRVLFTRVAPDGARLAIGELPIEGLDVGRYTCLTRHPDGRLAGLVFASADAGDAVSRLYRVEALVPEPVSDADWAATPIVETPLPPRSAAPCAGACSLGEVCVLEGGAEVCGAAFDLGGGCGECGPHGVCVDVNDVRICRPRVYGRYEADRLPFGEGLFASCAAGGAEVHAAWYDADERRLVAARWPFGPADRVVVDEGERRDPGRFASIAVGGGRLGIAYQDAAQGTLMWAEAPSWGAAWRTETLPTSAGGEPGISARALFSGDRPVVVHLDGRSASVELLARGSGCWARDVVFSGAYAYPDLLVDAGGAWIAAQALVFSPTLAPRHAPALARRALPSCD